MSFGLQVFDEKGALSFDADDRTAQEFVEVVYVSDGSFSRDYTLPDNVDATTITVNHAQAITGNAPITAMQLSPDVKVIGRTLRVFWRNIQNWKIVVLGVIQ